MVFMAVRSHGFFIECRRHSLYLECAPQIFCPGITTLTAQSPRKHQTLEFNFNPYIRALKNIKGFDRKEYFIVYLFFIEGLLELFQKSQLNISKSSYKRHIFFVGHAEDCRQTHV